MSSSGKRGETPPDNSSKQSGNPWAFNLDDPGMQDTASFLAGGLDPKLSQMKGRCYYYPIIEKY